jgi:hypothetical protein
MHIGQYWYCDLRRGPEDEESPYYEAIAVLASIFRFFDPIKKAQFRKSFGKPPLVSYEIITSFWGMQV